MKKITLFKLPFVVTNLDVFSNFIIRDVLKQRASKVLPTTLNEVAMANSSPPIMALLRRFDYLTMDGMPLVFLAKIKGSIEAERVYGPELMEKIYKKGQVKQIKHFLYGGTPEVLNKLSLVLEKKYPQSLTVGQYAPPFRSLTAIEKKEIVREIKKAKPDIIWVGLGSNKQIEWIDEFFPLVSITCIGVGAAFDFLSGSKRQAPKFIRHSGFEWLFRLLTEPRRLWKRYLFEIPTTMSFILIISIKTLFKSYMGKLVLKCSLFILSVVFSLCIAEMYLFVTKYQIRDHSWIFSNEEFVQNGSYRNFFTLDRAAIFKPRPNTSIIPDHWETDGQGFRLNPAHVNMKTPTHRILVIGDSFAYGHNVTHEEAWAALLEKSLRGLGHDVIIDNAGVPAYGTDQEFIRLENKIKLQHYDFVIWMVSFNDMTESNESCLFRKDGSSGEYTQVPAFLNVAYINAFLTKFLPNWFTTKTRLGNYLTTTTYKEKDLFTLGCSKIAPDDMLTKPYFMKLSYFLAKAKSNLEKNDTQLLVVLGPSQSYFDQKFTNDSYEIHFLSYFIDAFKKSGVQFTDINSEIVSKLSHSLSQFRGIQPQAKDKDHLDQNKLSYDLFLDEGAETGYGGRHMNVRGNEEIEQVLFEKMKNHLLKP